jgi:hypothetical protein
MNRAEAGALEIRPALQTQVKLGSSTYSDWLKAKLIEEASKILREPTFLISKAKRSSPDNEQRLALLAMGSSLAVAWGLLFQRYISYIDAHHLTDSSVNVALFVFVLLAFLPFKPVDHIAAKRKEKWGQIESMQANSLS